MHLAAKNVFGVPHTSRARVGGGLARLSGFRNKPQEVARSVAGGSSFSPMPTNLKRYYGAGDLHFITFSCHRRLQLLTPRRRDLFLRQLEVMRGR